MWLHFNPIISFSATGEYDIYNIVTTDISPSGPYLEYLWDMSQGGPVIVWAVPQSLLHLCPCTSRWRFYGWVCVSSLQCIFSLATGGIHFSFYIKAARNFSHGHPETPGNISYPRSLYTPKSILTPISTTYSLPIPFPLLALPPTQFPSSIHLWMLFCFPFWVRFMYLPFGPHYNLVSLGL